MISEARSCGYRSRMRCADTSCGFLAGDYLNFPMSGMDIFGGIRPSFSLVALQCRDNANIHLVYHVDKNLGILPGEIFERLELITIREDGRYQIDALVWKKGRADQPFPGGRVTGRGNAVKPTNR